MQSCYIMLCGATLMEEKQMREIERERERDHEGHKLIARGKVTEAGFGESCYSSSMLATWLVK